MSTSKKLTRAMLIPLHHHLHMFKTTILQQVITEVDVQALQNRVFPDSFTEQQIEAFNEFVKTLSLAQSKLHILFESTDK